MHNIYIGIDNGVTGTIGILGKKAPMFVEIPTKKEQNYTKKKDLITRIDSVALAELLRNATEGCRPDEVFVAMERPLINPQRFSSTVSAARALESVLCTIEAMGFGYMYLDSKEWQRKLLPQGISGPAEQKKASLDIATRLFPSVAETIKKHKDGDGILIAEHIRREGL